MSRLTCTTCLLSIAVGLSAQKPLVRASDPALNAVAGAYPDARDVEWGAEGDDFEAEFEQGGKEIALLIGRNGTIKETRIEIDRGELPEGARQVITSSFEGKRIRKAFRITFGDGSEEFAARIGRGESSRTLHFDGQGRFLRTEMKEREDEDDND